MDSLRIRPPTTADRAPIAAMLDHVVEFTREEIACAIELLDLALDPRRSDYTAVVAEWYGEVAGYACFGPTSMTAATYDLFWFAIDPARRNRGIGRVLAKAVVSEIGERGGRLIRIETSSTEPYEKAKRFYESLGFAVEARIREFYKPGDDLLVMVKRL